MGRRAGTSAECGVLNRVRSSEYRVLSRVLNRAYLIPHRSNRQPLTPNRPRSARQVGTSVPAGPRMWDTRPTGDGQPYLKRQSTDYGVQSAESSAESSVPDAASPNPQPLTPNRSYSARRRSALPEDDYRFGPRLPAVKIGPSRKGFTPAGAPAFSINSRSSPSGLPTRNTGRKPPGGSSPPFLCHFAVL